MVQWRGPLVERFVEVGGFWVGWIAKRRRARMRAVGKNGEKIAL